MESSAGPALDASLSESAAARCPVAHTSAPPAPASAPPVRSRADRVARAVLRIPDRPRATSAAAHTAFQRSMGVSALRCTLTYLVFPILLPLIGLGVGVGPAIGIAIGVTAIVCDVFAIRRFFAADHPRRWQFTALISGVLVLLVVLLMDDITSLA